MLNKTLFNNGKVWQENGTFPEAFGVEGKHFNFAGSNAEASRIKNNYNKIIDLEGRLVLPGLIDGHVHLVSGSLMRKKLNCSNAKTIEDLRLMIKGYAELNPDKEWIVGGNLNLNLTSLPFQVLDDIISDRPAYIVNYDRHSGFCNSLALEKSGLISKLTEFNDVEVPKNSNLQPAGTVKERAMNFISDKIPKPGLEEKVNAVYECVNVFKYYGITGVSDISQPDDMEVFKNLYEIGKLKLRINSYLPFSEFNNSQKHNESIKETDNEFFSIKGFKEYYDGALGSETALFKENYTGKSYNGYKTKIAESSKLYELAKEIDKEGRQIIIHAIGDKAVYDVLDICGRLTRENGIKDRRMRIEHAQHIDEADFGKFKKLSVIASVQPIHLKYDEKTVKEKLPGIIAKRTHNYKQLIERDVIVNFGTDFPIAEINPYENIQLAVTRKVSDEIFFPENKINLHDCIKAYTINNAFAGFNEDKRGSIEKGKLADFLIMEDNIFEITEDEIKNSKVWKTYLNGEEIYCNE